MRFSLDNFHWNQETRTLTAEVSSLENQHLERFITIFNKDTGNERRFAYMRTDKDDEGDIQGWQYYNADSNIRLVIFND